MKQVHGVIFDVDGTLIDSNKAHARSWVEAMAEFGHNVPLEKVGPLIGMGGDKVLPEVLGIQKDSEQGKKIEQRRGQIFKERYLPTLKAFPRTMDLLRHLHDHGLKLIIATSAKPDELQPMLRIIDPHAPDLFSLEATSKDASESKPDPDVMQAALKRSGYSPDEVVMIGDTAYDIEAAARSDIKTIAFRSGGWSDQDLQGAIAIYDGPADLLAYYLESPIAKGISEIAS